jgi:hypothetical protein
MAFPISPANNVTTVVNGIIYIYNSSNNSWKVVANTIIDGFARTTGNNAFNQANAVFTQSNTYVWPAANSAGAYANAAFATANSGGTSDFTNISITSATYGNASYYPIITVSANGRVNTVTTQVVTGIDAHPFFFTAMGS